MFKYCIAIILFVFILQPLNISAQPNAKKFYKTNRVETPPVIDGILSDVAWSVALWQDDILQSDPVEFAAPSEKTSFAVFYDDHAVYVGFRCNDKSPQEIDRKLRRRDTEFNSDWVYVGFDSRFDKQTAFVFGVSSSGVMHDFYSYNDGNNEDDSWDAVWEAETAVSDSGWTAEFKIPYSALRFPPRQEHIWGMNTARTIDRKNEEMFWIVVPRNESGFASKFGELHGINNIPQPTYLEVMPYGLGKYSNTSKRTGFDYNAGLDLKYSLNSGFIVDAAVNPDFGQVESDPAELNLGVFETFLEERRPFFLEGSSLFNTPFMLFYSRRIGSYPDYYSPDEDIIDQPENTTILGAVKITGKNAQGISLGIVEAVTDREYADLEDDSGNNSRGLLEPYASHLAARVMKDIWKGNSTLGMTATALNREAGMSAYTGGVDWLLRFKNNEYRYNGQLVFSDRGDTPSDRQSGYGFTTNFEREGGKHHNYALSFTAKSPDLNINDMGYTSRNDYITAYAGYYFRMQEPYRIFRKIWSGIDFSNSWNYDDVELGKSINPWVNFQFLNYFWFNAGLNYNFNRCSDLETRGGPLIKPPDTFSGWVWTSTDQSKKTYISLNYWGGHNQSLSWWDGAYTFLSLQPIEKLGVSIGLGFDRMFDENQWVNNIDDDNDSTHYVFGRLNQRTVYMNIRSNYSFNRDMSLQVYMQPYNAVGQYAEYVELAEPNSYKFQLYDPGENYDFNWKNFIMNLVFRWEYAPGSVLFAVWNRGMSLDNNFGSFDYNQNFRDLIYAEPDDIFMIKINKWFNF